jgi:hypothetical protein
MIENALSEVVQLTLVRFLALLNKIISPATCLNNIMYFSQYFRENSTLYF